MFKISWKGGIAKKSIKTYMKALNCIWLMFAYDLHLLIIHVLLVFLNIYTNLLNHDCFKACFYKKFGLTMLRLVMGFHWTGCFCLIEALFLFSSEIFFYSYTHWIFLCSNKRWRNMRGNLVPRALFPGFECIWIYNTSTFFASWW